MAHATLREGDLTAVVGDNAAYDGHRAGYNGLHSLTHASEPRSLFVPGIAGLNFEHIFDGEKEFRDFATTRETFFEPRRAPMEFSQISASEAELHQPPTPTFKVESWTRFKLVAPHYIDFTFRCRTTENVFAHGYIGLFWACYIQAPEDKSMYFRHAGNWQQFCTQVHNDESTVMHADDTQKLPFNTNGADCLFINFSPLKFDELFFYGTFRDHVFILMFEERPGSLLRFTHSPSGGGQNAEQQTSNPAWDWQFVLPEFELNKVYEWRARAVYRPKCSREEILAEVQRWKSRCQGAAGIK